MASSWCKETPEKINYTKLCRLLVDGGTQAVRYVFNGIHPPSSLTAILNVNKTTLQKLKKPKGKVLNNEQWDKLYPPSGIKPISKDFDITLLFVLLRNICSLTPPVYEITSTRKRKRSWDELPHKTDNSLEANLVRIKYYRNNTIAHKPNTEINDVDFEQCWQDISSALLSLGLNQEDIDDLKSARLGEKDYNQLLYDWYRSDEDITTQLENLQSNTTAIKSDTTDIKLDTTAIKSDTTAIKSDTTTIKSDTTAIKSGTTAIKSDTTAIKTDTTAIKTDTTAIKSDTTAIKSDTTAIKSYTTAIKSDTTAIKSDTTAIKSDTTAIKSNTTAIKSDTTDIKLDTAAIKDGVDDLKIMYEAHKQDKHIDKLAVSDFKPEITTRCKSFHPNTRQGILDQVKSHVDNDQPESCILMVITAGPGMGKSTVAAKICETYKDLGCLGGCHFFQFSNSTRNNPRLMLQSIARQMCDTVPGYRDVLERKLETNLGKKITEMNCEDLLTILLEEPLCNLEQTDSNFVVVIDALDECSYDLKNELMTALKNKLSRLPSWLRFIITTRPSTNTSVPVSTVAVEINPEDKSNLHDLEVFFCSELKSLYPQYRNEDLVKKLLQMTKGLFLVAYFVIDFLKRENVTSPEKVLKLFPNGISSVYENYFSRLKQVLPPYISEEEGFYKMLEAIVAAQSPLPKNMFYNILGLKSERDVPRPERKTRKDALNLLHSLFPVENDHVTIFHKSVVDWLILEGDEQPEFSVRIEDGNKVLANQCCDVICDIRNGNKDLDKPLDLTDSEIYALRFGLDLIESSSTIDKGKKVNNFSNLYFLTAIISENPNGTRYGNVWHHTSILCDRFDQIFQRGRDLFANRCRFLRRPTFGRYLEFVLQAAHARGVTEETKQKSLDALKKYNFSYCETNIVLQFPQVFVMPIRGYALPLQCYVHICEKGFLGVDHVRVTSCNPPATAIGKYQLDGNCTGRKYFVGERKITTSPNTNFIVVTEEVGNKIEIVDFTTLGVIKEYASPHDEIQTCHVFGDDRCRYIVIKGRNDNKIYVIEGLTGRLRNTITVNEDSKVIDVSCQGHIVITRTRESVESEGTSTFTDKDGNTLERMNWETGFNIFTYREMFLYHYERAQESIPIYPLAEKICSDYGASDNVPESEAAKFSQDGRLLAYHYKNSIFVVNTSDGSLFKCCSFEDGILVMPRMDILLVSERYIIFYDRRIVHGDISFLFVINVQTNEIEHSICLPLLSLPTYISPFPKEAGKPLTLLLKDNFEKVSQLVFHNLEL